MNEDAKNFPTCEERLSRTQNALDDLKAIAEDLRSENRELQRRIDELVHRNKGLMTKDKLIQILGGKE
ncbi:hypothetical protein KCG48_05035 [Proteiniclasticum sp. BAD-10]|uniref:Uncharacterized protein n=1 Tax=Proteiniclasticum sediminis TaxID=2804028 RepID=A0A941CN24_9CLOT|nr:hypothetical protein [Proteiniclasticum sediminis]MBR0575705.1 hypothetical protein [Proteiniclasticum sediminis]